MTLAARVKRSAKRVLRGRSGVLRAIGRLAPPGAVVLMYHSVQPDPKSVEDSIGEGISHSAVMFDRQMELLSREFHPVGLDDVAAFLTEHKALPRRAVVVTFDDGFRDNLEVAAPILARHGISATFYVTAGCIESGLPPWVCRVRHSFRTSTASTWHDPTQGTAWQLSNPAGREEAMLAAMRICATLTGDRQEALLATIARDLHIGPCAGLPNLMLSWEEVRSLQGEGHTIGSHTMSHPNVAHISLDEVRSELGESKQLLESRLGTAVRHFSYPCPILSPHWSPQTETVSRELGYATAATTDSGLVRAGSDAHAVPRIGAPMEMDEFAWALEVSLLGHRL